MRGGAGEGDFAEIQPHYICGSQRIEPAVLATFTKVDTQTPVAGKEIVGLYKMSINGENVYFKVNADKKPPKGIYAYLT